MHFTFIGWAEENRFLYRGLRYIEAHEVEVPDCSWQFCFNV